MYISWYFEYFPKVLVTLSLIFNSIFIYLNLSDRKKSLGNYRYFLLSFSLFNTIYSVVEVVIPVAVYGSNYVLIVYLEGGPFFKTSFGQWAVAIRCSFIPLSYAILTIHFFYRYFALFNPRVIENFTSKAGIFFMLMFFISHAIVWVTVCQTLSYATEDARDVARAEFWDLFNVNISEIDFVNIVYRSPNTWTVCRSWLGISILSVISGTSITLYCILGYKIFKKLQDADYISCNTRKLHRQLLRTLAIQTIIPTVISFLPCMIVWFLPFFGVHIGNYGNIGMVALLAFPPVDAIAVILLLPVYRNRFTKLGNQLSSVIAIQPSVTIKTTSYNGTATHTRDATRT